MTRLGLGTRIGRAAKAAAREIIGPWPLTDFPTSDKGADLGRLVLDWVATTASPDWEIRGVGRRLRARARELERNNAYAAAYLQMLAVNVIGPHGISLQARIMKPSSGGVAVPNDIVNDKVEDCWNRWCEAVTADGRFSMTDFAELSLKTVARDGELFVRERTSPEFYCGYALEPVDCDLVQETLNQRPDSNGAGEIRMGVEVTPLGRPLGYHLSQDYGAGAQDYAYLGSNSSRTVRVPAAEMLHLARFRRVNQTRGVTWLGPTMIALRMLDGYEEAELVAARTAAAKMGFFEQMDAREPGFLGPDDPTQPFMLDASPGTLEQLPKGYKFSSWDPQHPTAQFPAFVKGVLRKVAAGLGVSYNALASDLEGVNYSSMRSGLLIERDTWRRLQQWWIQRFLQRVYRNWLRSAIASGELNVGLYDPRKLEAVRWFPRGWAWVDPKKDGEAAVIDVQTGLGSRQQLLAEQGLDFETVLEDLAEEDRMAKAVGLDISGPRRPPDSAGTGGPGESVEGGEPGGESDTPPAREAVIAALRNGRNGHA